MKNKNEGTVKADKAIALVGGTNLMLLVYKGLTNMVEGIREGNALRLFTPASNLEILSWAAINLALLWKLHEIGKARRWPDNKLNEAIHYVYDAGSSMASFFKNIGGTSAPLATPTPNELELHASMKIRNLENMCQNIAEGGAAVVDAATAYLTKK